jgi:hypothetical protein
MRILFSTIFAKDLYYDSDWMNVIKTDSQPPTTISLKNDDLDQKRHDDSSGGVSIGMDLFDVTGGSRHVGEDCLLINPS